MMQWVIDNADAVMLGLMLLQGIAAGVDQAWPGSKVAIMLGAVARVLPLDMRGLLKK